MIDTLITDLSIYLRLASGKSRGISTWWTDENATMQKEKREQLHVLLTARCEDEGKKQ